MGSSLREALLPSRAFRRQPPGVMGIWQLRSHGDPRKLGMMPFGPCLDGQILPERPISRVSQGSAAGVPLLCGVMRDEFRLFSLGNAALQVLDEPGLETLAVASYGV